MHGHGSCSWCWCRAGARAGVAALDFGRFWICVAGSALADTSLTGLSFVRPPSQHTIRLTAAMVPS